MAEKWTEVETGVFVRRHRSLDLNVGAVVCGDGVLVIDTRATHVQAAEMVESLRPIPRLPVRWVINTHHHWDHTFGNQVFPDAAIWGHERCAEAMRLYGLRLHLPLPLRGSRPRLRRPLRGLLAGVGRGLGGSRAGR